MVWNGIREKPHRLDKSLYRGFVQCSFTAKLKPREKVFVAQATFAEHEAILLEALSRMGCEAHIYLFMPDHLHVILEGRSDESDVRGCMTRFKQGSSFLIKKYSNGELRWQKDFHDRIIRNEHELRTKLNYVLMNPVRGGLAESWKDYPYWGSTIYSKEALIMGAKP
jgi:putative transposase